MAPASGDAAEYAPVPGIRFSIRSKLVLVTLLTLALSFGAYLFFGTALMTRDKISYVYDFTASEANSAAEALESQISGVERAARLAAGIDAAHKLGELQMATLIRDVSPDLGLSGFSLFRTRTAQEPELLVDLAPTATPAGSLRTALAALGWTARQLVESELVVGPEDAGFVSLGGRAGTAADLAFLARIRPRLRAGDELGRSYSLYVLDPAGRVVLSRDAAGLGLSAAEVAPLAGLAPHAAGKVGARSWGTGRRQFIAGYRKISGGLLVVSLLPMDTAFSAVRALVSKTVLIGLGILLFTSGIALALARALTARLSLLWRATQRLSAGDLEARVKPQGWARDEITGLSFAFDAMAGKIQALIRATADKVRMENELETGQAFQNGLIPKSPFSDRGVTFAGTYVPATECAGDWWKYFQLKDQVLVVIADATGHGVSAALTSSLLQGACMVWVGFHRDGVPAGQASAALTELVRTVNDCALASAGAMSATSTFAALLLDLESGMLTVANAAHPPVCLLRASTIPGEREEGGFARVKFLATGGSTAIGMTPELRTQTESVQLQAGDILLLHSDGLFDRRSSDGKRLRKLGLIETIQGLRDGVATDASHLNDTVRTHVTSFFTDEGKRTNTDDLTLVLGTVSRDFRGT